MMPRSVRQRDGPRYTASVSKFLVFIVALALAGCGDAMSPLHVAALKGDAEAVRQWIAAGKNLDLTYDEKSRGLEGNYARRLGITPLMVAAGTGRLDIVRLLVEGGANLYAESNTQVPGEPRTAFDDAVEAGRIDIARHLWERSDRKRLGARLDRQIAQACRLHCDATSGTDAGSNLVLFLLSIAAAPQRDRGIGDALCTSDPASRQAQFVAAHVKPFPKGVLPCVAYTSLARTVRTQAQREALIDWMLAQGADLEHAATGYPALMGAASTHDVPMVRFLLARGARPDTADAHGVTAIGVAAGSCVQGGPQEAEHGQRLRPQLLVVEELLRAGADTSAYTPDMIRTRLPLLAQCCARQPRHPAQQRICEVFGL